MSHAAKHLTLSQVSEFLKWKARQKRKLFEYLSYKGVMIWGLISVRPSDEKLLSVSILIRFDQAVF